MSFPSQNNTEHRNSAVRLQTLANSTRVPFDQIDGLPNVNVGLDYYTSHSKVLTPYNQTDIELQFRRHVHSRRAFRLRDY